MVFEPFNYYTKTGFVVNIGRAHLCASLGELSSEHVVFNISKRYLTKLTLYMTPYKKFIIT